MSEPTRFDRRTVLKAASATVALAALGIVGTACKPPPKYTQLAALGSEYLLRNSDEATAEVLRTHLVDPGAGAPYSFGTDPAIMLAGLAGAILADFQEDRTVAMSGHLLSETECRVAAYWKLFFSPA